MKCDETDFIQQLIRICEQESGSREIAKKAIRSLCREFGGCALYFAKKARTEHAEIILELFERVCDKETAYRMRERMLSMTGGLSYYIPLEEKQFKDDLARDIYQEYDGKQKTMRSLCLKYHTSCTNIYRLYKRGQKLVTNQQGGNKKECL